MDEDKGTGKILSSLYIKDDELKNNILHVENF